MGQYGRWAMGVFNIHPYIIIYLNWWNQWNIISFSATVVHAINPRKIQ